MKAIFKASVVIVAVVLLGSVMAYLAGLFESKIPIESNGAAAPVDSDRLYIVESTTEPLIEQASGTIRAKVETVISPLINATISSIAVWSGDEVKAGDVLVKLDSRELRARVDQAHQAVIAAEARLAKAEKDFKRAQGIYRADSGAISKAELDRIQTVQRSAGAEFLRLRRQKDETMTALGHGTLTAPITGRIVKRYADPGDTARQGEPLLRMYDPQTLRLEANVRESVAAKLVEGQSLTAQVDAVNKRYAAAVDEIVPSADPGSRSFVVKVSLTGGAGLYPGMFGRLMIPIGEIEKIYIPNEAVTNVGQLNFVVVKTQHGPGRRYVRLGQQAVGNRVEVASGLAPGEKILAAPR